MEWTVLRCASVKMKGSAITYLVNAGVSQDSQEDFVKSFAQKGNMEWNAKVNASVKMGARVIQRQESVHVHQDGLDLFVEIVVLQNFGGKVVRKNVTALMMLLVTIYQAGAFVHQVLKAKSV